MEKENKKTTNKKVINKVKKPVKKVPVKKEVKIETKVSVKKPHIQMGWKLSDVLLITGITLIVSFSVGVFITMTMMKKTELKVDKNIEEFIKQYDYVIDNYYKEVDKDSLIDGAISGMLDSLDDKHAGFIDQDNNTLDQTLQGSYEGVGIEVYNDNENNIVILSVFKDSPAKKAGLQPGDIIVSIDGKNMQNSHTTELSSYIKKNSNKKKFVVKYLRGDKTSTVVLQKKYLVIPSVSSKTYEQNDKKIGYLRISTFSATTFNQFKTELESLEKQNIDSLIIDLRNNTGGHLNVVSDMLSLMMDKKHVLYQIQVKDEIGKFYSKGEKTKTYPIVVLQNGSSASASELMSSALQEQMGAKVVGEPSYGKGTVQELINLSDGNQYKFTTKKWLTSNGKWINDIGVTPNVKVSLNEKYYETGKETDDNQLQSALTEASK